jgi:hypothetical protein
MYTYEFSIPGCFNPGTSGGIPDLTAGGFSGFLDYAQTDDLSYNYVLFYGDCGEAQP